MEGISLRLASVQDVCGASLKIHQAARWGRFLLWSCVTWWPFLAGVCCYLCSLGSCKCVVATKEVAAWPEACCSLFWMVLQGLLPKVCTSSRQLFICVQECKFGLKWGRQQAVRFWSLDGALRGGSACCASGWGWAVPTDTTIPSSRGPGHRNLHTQVLWSLM